MTPRPNRRALLVALAGLCAGCVGSLFLPREVGFSVDELQKRLAERFPWRKTFYNLFEVELTNPLLAFDAPRGRIGSAFDIGVRLAALNRGIAGRAALSGIPRFDGDKRAFFLGEPNVDELALNGVPRAFSDDFHRIAKTLAVDVLTETPLYALRDGDDRFLGMTVRPSAIRVTPDRLVVGLTPQR